MSTRGVYMERLPAGRPGRGLTLRMSRYHVPRRKDGSFKHQPHLETVREVDNGPRQVGSSLLIFLNPLPLIQ